MESWDCSSRSIAGPLPTSSTLWPYFLAACIAPSTSGTGALSPPIASTAMVIMGSGYRNLESLLGCGLDDFAALVLSAVRTDAVRDFGFVAVGALGVSGLAEGVV